MTMEVFRTAAIKGNDSEFFSGRSRLVETALKTLKKKTQTCVIFGERGIGKTSLAWQIISSLEKANPRFDKLASKVGIGKGQFLCFPIKNLEAPRDVPDLLVQAVLPSQEPRSLFRVIPEVYRDGDFLSYIKTSYDLDLLSIKELSAFSSSGDARMAERLFNDVVQRAKRERPESRIVFFVDEADQMTDRTGLGNLLKNTNHAKFVLVGIADTMSELVGEHESALRKVIGGVLEVKPLSDKRIIDIYKKSVRASGGRLQFSQEFMERILRYSAGFPWIAQHVGDQVTTGYGHLLSQQSSQDSSSQASSQVVEFQAKHFERAWPIVRKAYSSLINRRISYDEINEAEAIQKVIAVMLKGRQYQGLDDLEKATGLDYNATDIAVRRLVRSKILTERPDHSYRFTDPIIRSFVLEMTEAASR